MTYNEKDLEQYHYYMLYVEDELNKALIPKSVKKQMRKNRHLHKDNQSWFLYEPGGVKGYVVRFIPFTQWLLQTDRDKKLEQLGI